MTNGEPGANVRSYVAPAVILLDKTAELSSFAALGAVKRTLGTRKVGHTGTLDPFATGLIVALVGKATKCAPLFSSLSKRYLAQFAFGEETDTLDPTGEVVRTAPPPGSDALRTSLREWVGDREQTPPAYSAVHVDGRRAYELARAGVVVQPKPRTVSFMELNLSEYRDNVATVEILCSSGTYVRSLARDIGRALGSAAHVRELRRLAVGPFEVAEVPAGEGFRELSLLDALGRLSTVSLVAVEAREARMVRSGGALAHVLRGAELAPGEYVLHHQREPLAIVTSSDRGVCYRSVLAG